MPKKRKWNDRVKLAMGELESKMQRELFLKNVAVETDKKQVALSFDAAWGNGWLIDGI